ncbi:MAG: preprotein translocase subunit SecG [Alistipes sp.]|nr:preprotein translocase subunit SecG [Alistipes sp.]
MYLFCIIMIAIASILLILAVLVQSPKSGMAANFGAANQTMGVRQTSDFLEKFTWAMIAAVVFFTLLSVVALSVDKKEVEAAGTEVIDNLLNEAKAEAEVEEVVLENEADPNATEVVEETAEVVEE